MSKFGSIQRITYLLVAILSLTFNGAVASERISLSPIPGSMLVNITVPTLGGEDFVVVLPKTIGCYEMTMVNQNATGMKWESAEEEGSFIYKLSPGGLIYYTVKLVPYVDYVDIILTVQNLTRITWGDVWFFTLLAPQGESAFRDGEMRRTFVQIDGKPMLLSKTDRETNFRKEIMFYLHDSIPENHPPNFVEAFQQISKTRPDGNWMLAVNEDNTAWYATASVNPVFLFSNTQLSSLHVAPGFGDIGPKEKSEIVSRVYFAHGSLDDAIKRIETDLPVLAKRAKFARNESVRAFKK